MFFKLLITTKNKEVIHYFDFSLCGTPPLPPLLGVRPRKKIAASIRFAGHTYFPFLQANRDAVAKGITSIESAELQTFP